MTYLMTRGWAEFLRSRVLLRKRLGRLPTNREVKDAMDNTQNFGSAVTAEDIEESFANGDHVRPSLTLAVFRFLPLLC